MHSLPATGVAAQKSGSLRQAYRDGSTICIKCRRRCKACICRAGKPYDRPADEIDRARPARETSIVAWNSGRGAIHRELIGGSRAAGNYDHSGRSRIGGVEPRRTCRHETLPFLRGQSGNIRRVQRPHLFLAESPGIKEAHHRQRAFNGPDHGSSHGNGRNILPFTIVPPILSLHRARRAAISDCSSHLLHDGRPTPCVGGAARLFSFPRPNALRDAEQPPPFPRSQQVHFLYGHHRLYFLTDSRIWPVGLPRAPDSSSRTIEAYHDLAAPYGNAQQGERQIAAPMSETRLFVSREPNQSIIRSV